MANIFEQVQTQAGSATARVGQMPSGFVPTSGVTVQRTAGAGTDPLAVAIEGISGLAKFGKQMHTDIQVGKATEEFQKGAKDFIAEEEATRLIGSAQQGTQLEEQTAEFFKDGTSPVEEVALLTDMRARIKHWDAAFKQKRISPSEFKIKMESTLKKYISMNPSIAAELRQAASGALGFDPTGAEMGAIFSQQKEAAKTSDDVQKAALDVMKKWGMFDLRLSVEENVAQYGQKALMLENADKLTAFNYNNASKGNLLTKDLQSKLATEQSANDLASASRSIDSLIKDTSINEQDKLLMLNNIALNAKNVYRKQYPSMSASDIDSLFNPLNKTIELADGVIRGKLGREVIENRLESNVTSVLAGVSGTEKGARFLATTRIMKNLAIPSSLQLDLLKNIQSVSGLEKLKTDALGTNGKTSPFDVGSDLNKEGATAWNKYMKLSGERMIEGADPSNSEDVQSFSNFLKGTMVPMFSDPEQVQAIEYDTVLKMAGNPKFVDMLKSMPDTDMMKSKLARVTANYGTRLIQKFGNEAFDKYDPVDPTSKELFSLKEAVFGIDKERLVDINRDSSTGEFFFSPKAGLGGEKYEIASSLSEGYNKTYASRLNDSIKVTAHLKGHTNYKGMVDQYLERTPELLFFMKEAKVSE